MSAYAVINQQNEIVNCIMWDGVTEYTPNDGMTLIAAGDLVVYIGGVYDPNGVHKFVPPNPADGSVYDAEKNIWVSPASAPDSMVAVNPDVLPPA